VAPGIIARFAFREYWKKAWVIMLATMIVDIDHLFATPIYDICRCSIGLHFLHSYFAIAVYAGLFFVPKMRIISVGLLLHMLTDFLDCLWLQ
jgi:hypothetical protein